MKQELRAGNDLDISRELEEGVRDAILDGKQSILFLNRRGNSRYLVCMDCGDVPQCPRCSVHLTYHSSGRRLMCHYCGYSRPAHARCENCGGAMKAIGSGTQKIEQELKALFPDTELLRMDADTVAAAGSHEELLRTFREKRIPILLGTQMVAKGLDFPIRDAGRRAGRGYEPVRRQFPRGGDDLSPSSRRWSAARDAARTAVRP